MPLPARIQGQISSLQEETTNYHHPQDNNNNASMPVDSSTEQW